MEASVLTIPFIMFVSTIQCSPYSCIGNELQNIDPTPLYRLQKELSKAKQHQIRNVSRARIYSKILEQLWIKESQQECLLEEHGSLALSFIEIHRLYNWLKQSEYLIETNGHRHKLNCFKNSVKQTKARMVVHNLKVHVQNLLRSIVGIPRHQRPETLDRTAQCHLQKLKTSCDFSVSSVFLFRRNGLCAIFNDDSFIQHLQKIIERRL